MQQMYNLINILTLLYFLPVFRVEEGQSIFPAVCKKRTLPLTLKMFPLLYISWSQVVRKELLEPTWKESRKPWFIKRFWWRNPWLNNGFTSLCLFDCVIQEKVKSEGLTVNCGVLRQVRFSCVFFFFFTFQGHYSSYLVKNKTREHVLRKDYRITQTDTKHKLN